MEKARKARITRPPTVPPTMRNVLAFLEAEDDAAAVAVAVELVVVDAAKVERDVVNGVERVEVKIVDPIEVVGTAEEVRSCKAFLSLDVVATGSGGVVVEAGATDVSGAVVGVFESTDEEMSTADDDETKGVGVVCWAALAVVVCLPPLT